MAMLCSSWKFQYIGYWVRFCSWTTALLSSDSLQLWQYLPAQSLNVMQNNRTEITTSSTFSLGLTLSEIDKPIIPLFIWNLFVREGHISTSCSMVIWFKEIREAFKKKIPQLSEIVPIRERGVYFLKSCCGRENDKRREGGNEFNSLL